MMRRFFLIHLLIGAAVMLGCGQGEYDKRLEQSINNPERMAAAEEPVEEDEEGADEEESGEWTLADLEAEDAARAKANE